MSAVLFTIEIFFLDNNEVRRYVLRNMTAAKLKEFRETIVAAGLMMPADPEVKTPGFLGEWKIVLPWKVESITVYKQSKFFKDADNTKKD